MTTALVERAAVVLPKEQIDLIKRTVATGATNDELALFLYDCDRRGIHPLDKLLHFTKRGGKYTPVTSIDFMRSQAAGTGEMAGSEDPAFVEADGKLVSASVTVYRLTQGQRFPYAATARWSEYCPDNAPMWKRMPHTMLGKCAEALALRKAFPQQLAGLYSREEMDQADGPKGYVVEAPSATANSVAAAPSVPNGGDSGAHKTERVLIAGNEHAKDGDPVYADVLVDLVPGAYRIERVDLTDTRNPNVKKGLITVHTGETFATINPRFQALAEQFCQNGTPVFIEGKTTKWGVDVVTLAQAPTKAEIDETKWQPEPAGFPVDDSDIPF